jgi:hypothetical protein
MDFDGPYFDTTLVGPNGRLMRLHKGVKLPKVVPPVLPGKPARSVEMSLERDPTRRNRGQASTILTGGVQQPASRSILGG